MAESVLINATRTEAGLSASGSFTLNSKTARGAAGRIGRFFHKVGYDLDPQALKKISLVWSVSTASRASSGSFTLNSKTARLDHNAGGIIGRLYSKNAYKVVAGAQAMTLPSLSSGFASGAHTVKGQNAIALPGVATGLAFGSLTVTLRRIGLPGIATGLAFGALTVHSSNQITLPGLGSGLAFGTLRVSLRQIGLTGISSGLAFGTLRVSLRGLGLPGISSAIVFGTLRVSLRGLGLPGISTHVAFGTLTLVSTAFVHLASITTHFATGVFYISNRSIALPSATAGRAIGVPTLAGPLILPGLSSSFAVGALLVKLQQKILLGSISSAFVTGTAKLGHTQLLILPGVASAVAIGALLVRGSGLLVSLPSINTALRFGSLRATGGVQDIQVFIGGYNRTAIYLENSCQVQSQTLGRWNANLSLFDSSGSFAPALGQTVMVVDRGRKLFAGCLISIEIDRQLCSVSDITFKCQAVDGSAILDHRIVYATFLAGTDAAAVARSLFTGSGQLAGEGIGVDLLPATLGVLDTDLVFNYIPGTQALDQLADAVGCVWFLDVDKQLHIRALDQLDVCPFSITETSKNWRGLTVSARLADYRNRQFVRTNLNVLPGDGTAGGAGGSGGVAGSSLTETYTMGVNGQDRAYLAGLEKGYILLDFPIISVQSIKVNGTAQVIADWNLTPFYNPPGSVPGDPAFIKAWYYFRGNPNAAVVFPNDHISTGDVIEIKYTPRVQNVSSQAQSPLQPVPPSGLGPAPPGESFGTCGSGIYEAVEQVNDISTQNDLNAIAQAVLARSGKVPTFVSFETDLPGAAVGQRIMVDLPRVFLPAADAPDGLMITSLTGQAYPVDLGHGSVFRWRIEATTVPDQGNWIKWFERVLRRSDHPLPVLQYETSPFVLSPGGSIGGGLVSTNPSIVERTGRLYEILAAAGVPSTDQDLLLEVFSSTQGALLTTPLVLAAGSTDLVVVTQFLAPYVFKNDILTVVASYRVTGPNPTAAGSVTLKVRYTM